MKKLKYLIPCLFLLCGCSSSLPEVKENNTIIYDDVYDSSSFSFQKNGNQFVEDKKENIRNYFLSYASHMLKDKDYSIIYKGKLKDHQFRLNVTYDSSKKEKPYLVSSCFDVTDEDSRPYRSYFYSYYTDDFSDFRKDTYVITYSSIYLGDKKEMEADIDVTYTDIVYSDSPRISEVKFSCGSQENVTRKEQKSEKELGASGFECIRALSSYVDSLLKTINPDYSLW